MYEDLIETKLESENIFDGNLLHVKKDKVRLPNGSEAYREWVKHPGAAAVIPYTDKGEIILVRQYRYPIDEVTLEIPAGKLDVAGEDPLECAKRELSEETGYMANEYTYLTKLATSVGFSDEVIYIYAAKGLKAGKQHTDEDEFINVVKVPLTEAVKMVLDGRINDGKSITAIFMLDRLINNSNSPHDV
ncbi:NUDIX domain-containing protein [uncultured Anaerovibrio sp.]|uniref:NUDIX domain-containing protein n=1 Tax=uncultured Anaerovibrio sp. TaxID=361586 RepID=UPI0026205B02|nr:NUDIX hydrolase [uncultured Anaerovibrio sp.]